jgi:hypothetical protein
MSTTDQLAAALRATRAEALRAANRHDVERLK